MVFLLLPEETPGESGETAELGQSMGTVLEGTSAFSITPILSVEARKRIKAKAKAEEQERKADQGPEATHSHLRALEVLGLALKPERAPGLVGVPLPILNVRFAEITWLASAPEAKTANGIILLLANITRMEIAKMGKSCKFLHTERSQASRQSSSDRGRSPEKTPKGKKNTKKDASGGSQKDKKMAKPRKTKRES